MYKGNLTQNKWKDRYCVVCCKYLQLHQRKPLLASIPLAGAGVQLVSVPNEEVHHFTFRVCIPSGKSHMFVLSLSKEMYAWATTLQGVSYQTTNVKECP